MAHLCEREIRSISRYALCQLIVVQAHGSLMHVFSMLYAVILATRTARMRNLLLRCGWFGSEAGVSVDVKLARAHQIFKRWCKQNRVYCSQPVFKPRMVPSSTLVAFCCDFGACFSSQN